MAQFDALHQVGVALCDILRNRLGAGLDILPAPPLENPSGQAEAVRLTLLWITPQPTHRNDPWVRAPDGTLEPPPTTLSGFYLITAYGTAPTAEPEQAHNLLGDVIRVFDSETRIELPNPPATNLGEGRLGVVLVPTAADLMEKVYTPLGVRHRPWALFEVGPIQLRSRLRPGPEQPIVHPGGISLGLRAARPPRLERLLPASTGVGGRVRLDARYQGTVEAVLVGATVIDAPALQIPEPGGPVLFTLPAPPAADAVAVGAHDVRLRVDGLFAAPLTLNVRPAGVAFADAPASLTHPLFNDLQLTGEDLAQVAEAAVWPDSGVAHPDEVRAVQVSAVAANSVTLSAVDLAAAGVVPGVMRISLRTPAHRFTPYVVLEFTP
jgi:hypothetical protein